MSASFVVAPEHTRRAEADIADAPDAVAARRPRLRWIGVGLANVVFKILCLLIAGLLFFVFGVVGGLYLYVVV